MAASGFSHGSAVLDQPNEASSVVSGLKNEMEGKAIEVDTSTALTDQELTEVKQYIAYMEALLKKKDVQFSKEAIQQNEVVKQELDKKLTELKVKVQQREEKIATQKKKNLYLKWGIGGLSLFLIPSMLAFVLGKNNAKTRKKNITLEQTNKEIEEAYSSIAASINYAKKIQTSVLVKKEILDEYVQDSFILFKPQDIVSGDFYWFSEVKGTFVIAAVDCTGHGVAGAFMTMMGISFLNEIVNEEQKTHPSEILEAMHDKVLQSLTKRGGGNTQDSMQIAIVTMDKAKDSIRFSGANSKIAYKNQDGLAWLKFIAISIGETDTQEKSTPYVTTEMPLSSIDTLFLFTNGYYDQLGGEDQKRFGRKRFFKLLEESSDSCAQIQTRLEQEMQLWMDGEKQTDDMLVMGIKI